MGHALLEIGLEEVPARFIEASLNNINALLDKKLTQYRLKTDDTYIDVMGTYRRFGFIIHNIENKQPDINETLEGPPVAISRSESGEWLPPALGFAKKCNVPVTELTETKNKKGQRVLSARHSEIGQQTGHILPKIFQDAITGMQLPISMVWGHNTGPFIRPIKWLCTLFNDQPIDCEVFGVKSGHVSYGHRFLSASEDASSGEPIHIKSVRDYMNQLINKNVMVDINSRRTIIKDQLLINGADVDEALLNEVTHLVEWPEVLKISFPEQFLVLPKEILTECLKKHQKAFMISTDGRLKNECFIVADSVTNENREQIIAGNNRVMLARLNDVQFFWDEDLKNNGFSNWNEKLHTIVFQDGLGSMSEKVERVSHIAHTIMDQLNIGKEIRQTVYRAAKRAKSDLVSQMVKELPALQGVMGAYYAMFFKEDTDVVMAIRDQYKPKFDGDDFPETIPGVILSIADRLDTIVACFENQAIPTGSRDPWGLRRSIISIIRMIIHYDLDINLDLLIEDATLTLEKKIGKNTKKCREFFEPRLETVFQEHGISPDILKLVSTHVFQSPLTSFKQANKLTELKHNEPQQYNLLLETTARVAKIITGYNGSARVSNEFFESEIESKAYESFLNLTEHSLASYLSQDDVSQTITFCQTLTDYFDQVLINTDNKNIADNRRSFIKNVNDYFYTVGDWLKLQK